jgi:hypothetical protein
MDESMIARHEAHMDKTDIWSKLAAPLPQGVISWRQDGKPTHRDGKYFARFVAYIEANTVRERLDAVVPGEWDLTLELLPPLPGMEDEASACSFKARLQILGVIREDVGTGKDYKQAATGAFERTAVRFGIAHELYAYEQNWVQVDGEGRYAKPVEDPQTAYARRYGTGPTPKQERAAAAAGEAAAAPTKPSRSKAARAEAELAAEPTPVAQEVSFEPEALPSCPKCGGKVWDNRATKRNPKAPDFKCRDRTCDGVIWPPKGNAARPAAPPAPAPAEERGLELDTAPLGSAMDEIPF